MTTTRPDQIVTSTELVEVEIVYKIVGKPADPTSFPGFIAFGTSDYDDPPSDFTDPRWHSANWTAVDGRYALTVKVGPRYGGIVLDSTPGVKRTFHVWAGFDDASIQAPIVHAGTRTFR